jgi:hypothetical protein
MVTLWIQRLARAVCLAASLPAFAGEPTPPAQDAVSVVSDGPAIIRQTPDGDERQLYLSIANATGAELNGLVLHYTVGHAARQREILPVPPGGAWDTLWVPAAATAPLSAELFRGDEKIWNGLLALPAAGNAAVTIRRSPAVQLADLQPLMLRGANYYPRVYPWPGLWREATAETFEREFKVMNDLGVNTFRTFYIFDPDRGLHRPDGAFTPTLIARIDTLLTMAESHHLKVLLCLVGGVKPPLSDLGRWRRYFRTGVEPFIYDGRILMWDLMNEPGGDKGPQATPELSQWLQRMAAELQALDAHHLWTVGLCWQFDQLWALGVKPPVGQFHNYSGAVGVQPPGAAPVRNVADDLRKTQKFIGAERPLIVGEFGYASVADAQRKDASPERQRAIYAGVLTGAETAGVAGVYNWVLFHFEPDWMGKGEQSFGIVNLDGTLKPAGELLRDTYRRWREKLKAPWE